MQISYRKTLIKVFTFLGGIYFFLYFVLPESLLTDLSIKQHHEDISLGFIAIGLLAFGLGLINLLMIHGSKIAYKRKGWPHSLALLMGLLTMLVFSILDWRMDTLVIRQTSDLNMLVEFARSIQKDAAANRKDVPETSVRMRYYAEASAKILSRFNTDLEINPYEQGPEFTAYQNLLEDLKARYQLARTQVATLLADTTETQFLPLSVTVSEIFSLERDLLTKHAQNTFDKKFFAFLFQGLFVSLGSALFSLLGVYIAAAAYRAFRIRTWESSLMMAAALIVMLGQISFGTWIYSELPAIRGWILEVPNSAASRAITIGAYVAGLILAFRMWFSIESDTFSQGKK